MASLLLLLFSAANGMEAEEVGVSDSSVEEGDDGSRAGPCWTHEKRECGTLERLKQEYTWVVIVFTTSYMGRNVCRQSFNLSSQEPFLDPTNVGGIHSQLKVYCESSDHHA